MSRIALLHPQCARLGGAIQMGLQSARALQEQGHTIIVYTFERSKDCFPELQQWLNIQVWNKTSKNPFKKLTDIITLSFHLRHVDIVIANNPPMQIVAALVKLFVPRVKTIWWHHHVPWYLGEGQSWNTNQKNNLPLYTILYWKGLFERLFIIPHIDHMIATSHYIAEKVQQYCGREATVIHPVLAPDMLKIAPNTAFEYDIDTVTLFTHGRLEPGKGLDMVIRVWKRLQKDAQGIKNIDLIACWTGSLEKNLREMGVEVRPFDRKQTFADITSGHYGQVIGVYASQRDAFGIASLEAQAAGIPTIMLDSGGAREAILTNLSDEPVWYLVDTEEGIYAAASYYLQKKIFPKPLSNVNFSHHRDYFTPDRLSSDLRSIIEKTGQ